MKSVFVVPPTDRLGTGIFLRVDICIPFVEKLLHSCSRGSMYIIWFFTEIEWKYMYQSGVGLVVSETTCIRTSPVIQLAPMGNALFVKIGMGFKNILQSYHSKWHCYAEVSCTAFAPDKVLMFWLNNATKNTINISRSKTYFNAAIFGDFWVSMESERELLFVFDQSDYAIG